VNFDKTAFFERSSLLLALNRQLIKAGSWAGETHMQKTVYGAQSLLAVPFGLDFVIYRHGPYSFELADDLAAMRGEEFLRLVPRVQGYGATLLPGDRNELLWKSYAQVAAPYEDKLRFIAQELGPKTVAELERICTLIYIKGKWKATDPVQKLVELKPHVTPELAINAAAQLEGIEQAARAAFPPGNY